MKCVNSLDDENVKDRYVGPEDFNSSVPGKFNGRVLVPVEVRAPEAGELYVNPYGANGISCAFWGNRDTERVIVEPVDVDYEFVHVGDRFHRGDQTFVVTHWGRPELGEWYYNVVAGCPLRCSSSPHTDVRPIVEPVETEGPDEQQIGTLTVNVAVDVTVNVTTDGQGCDDDIPGWVPLGEIVEDEWGHKFDTGERFVVVGYGVEEDHPCILFSDHGMPNRIDVGVQTQENVDNDRGRVLVRPLGEVLSTMVQERDLSEKLQAAVEEEVQQYVCGG